MYNYKAYLDRVIDGDTIVLNIDVGFHIFTKQMVRLAGIDCPERGDANYGNAKTFVMDKFHKAKMRDGIGLCIITTEKADSFGRWIADVLIDGDDKTLSQQLLDAGLAVPYAKK